MAAIQGDLLDRFLVDDLPHRHRAGVKNGRCTLHLHHFTRGGKPQLHIRRCGLGHLQGNAGQLVVGEAGCGDAYAVVSRLERRHVVIAFSIRGGYAIDTRAQPAHSDLCLRHDST